jgi:HAD superfamily hydrolase (TIGR01490 family)
MAGTLALFDLDHTLIPFDSGMAWTRFLVARGVLPADAEARYLAFCHQYVAGTLDIHAMHRASLQPLLRVPRKTVRAWQREFEQAMAPRIPPAALALVRRHQAAGDLCAIVTATDELVAAPFARLFGVEHLLATRAATEGGAADAPYTGEIEGEPCYREHKLTHVKRWLAALPTGGAQSPNAFTRSWFYSDSISDLPLLAAVSDPIAVRPDERLRARAREHGWPVLESL